MGPQKARIRMYRVGFGDCFLVSFVYAGGERRHVLIDFGTTAGPPGRSGVLLEIARNIRDEIAKDSGGKLHVVVPRQGEPGYRLVASDAEGTITAIVPLQPVLREGAAKKGAKD